MGEASLWRNACFALLAFAAMPLGGARAQDYPPDIATATPAAFAAWRAVTPIEYRNKAWIGQLNGVRLRWSVLNCGESHSIMAPSASRIVAAISSLS
jgi:hypothetical protein